MWSAVQEKVSNPQVLRFGTYEVDLRSGELRKNGIKVRLTGQPFQILTILLEHPDEVVTREQLQRRLWPSDTFVDFDRGLNAAINRVREALGDSAENPRFVETLPRRGYRFIGQLNGCPKTGSIAGDSTHGGQELTADGRRLAQWQRFFRVMVNRAPALIVIAATSVTLTVVGAKLWLRRSALPGRSQWVQLTNFPDSVTQPALSWDGRILAFIRGYSTWVGPGQIYVKLLPDGEPVQLTHDAALKTDPTFSPDGSRIAYTTLDFKDFSWDTVVSPTLGGDPQLLLRNASGLTWIGPKHVMFSEINAGVHMGIVAAEESRLGARQVYSPTDEPAMAHRSYSSPDRKWVLLAEMDKDHYFLPCRLVPMDGGSQGRHVGPLGGSCMSAAWSPDGKWMYFTANPGGVNHIWRQRFPNGRAEQITSGPTEEEGIAVAPDGHSFVTAVALQSTSLWVHDSRGEHQVSLEGNATKPKFTPDGKKLCYLISKEATNDFAFYRNPGELHIADLPSGRSEVFQRGLSVLDYDISADGRRIVMWTTGHDGKSQFWVAPFDHSSAPMQVPEEEGASPMFGPTGEIFFRRLEKTSTFVYRIRPDGTGLRKAFPDPIFLLLSVSPEGKWIIGWAPLPGTGQPAIQAFPLNGGPAVVIGRRSFLSWSLDGRSALLAGSYFVPLAPGESLPPIPKGGFQSDEQIAQLPGARRIEGAGVVPGPSADI
ncbi:MAG: PD40 domain-containing protein [Acidobacteria bacterium]|nr:PD40 domain-containing protein [Acidobacteriota bacterium]